MTEDELKQIDLYFRGRDTVTVRYATSLLQEIRRLREVLQWYADEKNYTTQSLGKCPIENSYVADDMGERAREALACGSGDGEVSK